MQMLIRRPLLILALLLAPSYAFSDACSAGTLNTLVGTSCSIGGVQFTFKSAWGHKQTLYYLYNWGNEYLELSSLSFTPYVNENHVGFTIGGIPGTATSQLGYNVQSVLNIEFTSSTASDPGGLLSNVNLAANSDPDTGAVASGTARMAAIVLDGTTEYHFFSSEKSQSQYSLPSSDSQNYGYVVNCPGACRASQLTIATQAVVEHKLDQSAYSWTNTGSGSASASMGSATFYVTVPENQVPEPSTVTLIASAAVLLYRKVKRESM